jgi:hypothetical protein
MASGLAGASVDDASALGCAAEDIGAGIGPVELYPENASAKDRYVDVTLPMLVKAVGQEKEFSDAEFRIRIFFEHYLTSLSRFN